MKSEKIAKTLKIFNSLILGCNIFLLYVVMMGCQGYYVCSINPHVFTLGPLGTIETAWFSVMLFPTLLIIFYFAQFKIKNALSIFLVTGLSILVTVIFYFYLSDISKYLLRNIGKLLGIQEP